MVTRYNETAEGRTYKDENGPLIHYSDYALLLKEMHAKVCALQYRLDASQGEIRILRAQLTARDAVLEAVLQFAMSQAAPANPACFEIVELLVKHGVHS